MTRGMYNTICRELGIPYSKFYKPPARSSDVSTAPTNETMLERCVHACVRACMSVLALLGWIGGGDGGGGGGSGSWIVF